MLDPQICQKARVARDPRFDGKFFTAVKTTGVYCRPICPATTPKEENVLYFSSAVAAANAGYRPCLRCRPDSAPGSPAWKGVNTTLDRAIRLIGEGILQDNSLSMLAEKLGISDRYLRQLFEKHLGISPKAYALYQQCLFAKQLLHQTKLSITHIALASGFNSVRRFNGCFQSHLNLTPSQIRKSGGTKPKGLQLQLYYRPRHLMIGLTCVIFLWPGPLPILNGAMGKVMGEHSSGWVAWEVLPRNILNTKTGSMWQSN